MKTNFTMKNYFLSAFVLMAFIVSSCEDDAPVVVEGAGTYEFGGGALYDGDVEDPNTTNLFITDGMLLLGAQGDIDIAPGDPNEVQITSAFVDAVLTGAAPCVGPDPTNYTYQIDLKSDLVLAFICSSEGFVSEDLGSWQLIDNKLSMSISVSFSPVPIPIVITNVIITETSISGRIEAFPMIKDAKLPIGSPIDGDQNNLNVQYISLDLILDKVI